MADQQVAVVVVKVEAGSFTVAPHFAVLALVFPSPGAVTHDLEAVLPDVPKVILVDVALVHVATDGGAAADGAITTNRGHLDTTAAVEEMVTNLLLVRAEEALAGVANIDKSFTFHL